MFLLVFSTNIKSRCLIKKSNSHLNGFFQSQGINFKPLWVWWVKGALSIKVWYFQWWQQILKGNFGGNLPGNSWCHPRRSHVSRTEDWRFVFQTDSNKIYVVWLFCHYYILKRSHLTAEFDTAPPSAETKRCKTVWHKFNSNIKWYKKVSACIITWPSMSTAVSIINPCHSSISSQVY